MGEIMQLEQRKEALMKQKEDLKVMFMKVEGALEVVNALIEEESKNSAPAKKESKKKEK
tara:strand:- start:2611 stop:2787 length:177 start_codon:yes stop_codon:yes gene_type:complete